MSNEKTFATVVGSGLGKDVSRFIEHVIDGDHPPCIEKALDRKNLLMIMDKSRECGDCFFRSACIGKETAIIRVENGGKLYGLLSVLFALDVSVDDEEKELLKEVSDDIALGLYNMELEEAHKQADETLRESEKKYRRIFEWGYPFNSGIYYILWLRFLGPLTRLMISPYGTGSTSIACCKRR